MRAVTPILAIALLVPFAGVQVQGPPSLAQVLAQARQQESEVAPTVGFPLVISVPATTFQTSERSRVLGVPTVEPNSPAALLWAAGATDLRLRSDSRPTPAPTRLSGAAKVAAKAGIIVGTTMRLLSEFAHEYSRSASSRHQTSDGVARAVGSWLLSGCR